MLKVDLDSPSKHGWDENLATVRSDIASPHDISDMPFEVDERNDYESNDMSSDNEIPQEYVSYSSDSEESDTEYYKGTIQRYLTCTIPKMFYLLMLERILLRHILISSNFCL